MFYSVTNNRESERGRTRRSIRRCDQNKRMKLGENRNLHWTRMGRLRLNEGYRTEALRAAGTTLALAEIMLCAGLGRGLVRYIRLVAVMRSVNGVRLAASGNEGKRWRRRGQRHDQGQQECQRVLDSEEKCARDGALTDQRMETNHTSDFSRY